jgi:hypothetical protein
MESRPAKIKAAFVPRTMGVFILLVIVLSFTAGAIRREMVLTLTGSLFLSVWIYSLVMTLLLALLHSRRERRVSINISPQKIVAREWTQVFYNEGKDIHRDEKIFQLPGILVRCRIILSTADGRLVTHEFKPEFDRSLTEPEQFQVDERGAYFSTYDEFAILDIFGFFRFAFRVSPQSGALLAGPWCADEPVSVRARGGETERQGPPIERSDELVSHRPYVPGDDPRRINWKLFSHGGELFVRQGEREPPAHSNITILIDTQFDSLYTLKSAREEVDRLCENSLAIINSFEKERDIQIGYTGQNKNDRFINDPFTKEEPGYFLAYPAAMPVDTRLEKKHAEVSADLPSVNEERALVILAMPRKITGDTALDRFLSVSQNRAVELFFIYSAGENERSAAEKREAAQACAALYGRYPNVRTHAVEVL